jgi:hypothetical protein
VEIGDALFDEDRLASFLRRPEALVWRMNKKGRQVAADLKKRVSRVELLSPTTVEMTIECAEGGSLRPAEVLREIFQLGEDALSRARILKTGSA